MEARNGSLGGTVAGPGGTMGLGPPKKFVHALLSGVVGDTYCAHVGAQSLKWHKGL